MMTRGRDKVLDEMSFKIPPPSLVLFQEFLEGQVTFLYLIFCLYVH